MMNLSTTNATDVDIQSNDDTIHVFKLTDSSGAVDPDLIRGFYIKLLNNSSPSLKIGFCSKTHGKPVPGSFCGSYLHSEVVLNSTDVALNMEDYQYFYI